MKTFKVWLFDKLVEEHFRHLPKQEAENEAAKALAQITTRQLIDHLDRYTSDLLFDLGYR
jgi:hypothetical protein